MLAQMDTDECYYTLEEMVDWHGLNKTIQRRRIPNLVSKLIAVYAPEKTSLEEWKKDFERTHRHSTVRKFPEDPEQVELVEETEQPDDRP